MRSVLLAALLTAALLVAGCGGGSSKRHTTTTNGGGNDLASMTGDQVVEAASKAVSSASSFHVSGEARSTRGKTQLDLSFAKGKGAVGTVGLRGTTIPLIVAGGNGYLKADQPGWVLLAGPSGGMIFHRLGGRWLKFPLDNPVFQPLTAYTDISTLFDQLQFGELSALDNKGVTRYRGEKVVEVHDEVKNGTLYVAATGPAYPVALVGSAGGTITFSDWNEPVAPKAPKHAVDFSRLTS